MKLTLTCQVTKRPFYQIRLLIVKCGIIKAQFLKKDYDWDWSASFLFQITVV